MILFPMLFGYIIFVVLPRKCTIPIISFWLRFLSILAVVDLLAAFAVFGCPIAERYEGFVAVGIDVDIGMFAVRVDFLQQMAAVSNETGLVFEVVPA